MAISKSRYLSDIIGTDGLIKTEATALAGVDGVLKTDDVAEGTTNLYYTQDRADARVAAGIANLVDTAPATLDTLNELAAALGDDPNFATTVTTALGTKANLAGATFTGNVYSPTFSVPGGSYSTILGGNALTFNRDSGASYIDNVGAGGSLTFRLNSTYDQRLSLTSAEVVINDESDDVDFRVESNTNANALFVDGGTSRVGINTSTPDATLDVVAGTTNSVYARFSSTDIRPLEMSSYNTASTDAGHNFNATSGNGAISFSITGVEKFDITSAGVEVNGSATVNGAVNTTGLSVNNSVANASSDILFSSSNTGSNYGIIGYLNATNTIRFYTAGSHKLNLDGNGHLLPQTSSQDLGSIANPWQNIYTQDLVLSNESRSEGNEVDGTKGNWTIQEGEEHLYIINNKNGKKYKFALEEIV